MRIEDVPSVGKPKESAKKPLTSEERSFWNEYVKHLESKGLKGSAELNKRNPDLSRKVFDEYAKGRASYDDLIPRVQAEASSYRSKAIDMIKAGKAQYIGYDKDKDFQKFMPGLSNVDGWAGSSTTNFKFPNEVVTDTINNKVVPRRNSVYMELAKLGRR